MSRVKDWQVVAEVANHGSNSPLYDRFDSAFKNLSSKENPSLVERQSLKRAGHSLYTKDLSGGRKDTGKGVEQIASIAKDKKEYPVTAYDDPTSHPNLVEKLSEFDRNVEIDKAERVHDKIMEESLIKETLRALKEKAHYEDAMFDSIAPQPQRRNPMEEGYPHGFQYFAEEEYDRSGYQRPPSTHDPVTSLPYDGQEGSYAGYKPSFNYFPGGTYDASGYQRPAPATHDPVTGLPYPDEKRVAPTGERRAIPTQEQYFDFANPEPSPINTPVVDQIHSLKKPEPELYASINPYISSPVQQQDQGDADRADQQRQASDYYLQGQPEPQPFQFEPLEADYVRLSRGASSGHEAIDTYAPLGTPIGAYSDGVVIDVNSNTGDSMGAYVKVWDPSTNMVHLYGHVEGVSVRPGDEVFRGMPIAVYGRAGEDRGGIQAQSGHGVLHHEVFNIGEYQPTAGQNYYRTPSWENVTGDYYGGGSGEEAYQEWVNWMYGR